MKRITDTDNKLLDYLRTGGSSGDIELSDKEKELLERARFADSKIAERKYYREEVANFIKDKFGVCRDTAFKDIVRAEFLFSSSAPLNKRYLIHSRIEFLQKKINELFILKDFRTAKDLEKELREYISIYPEYQPKPAPRNMFFIFNNEPLKTPIQDVEEAVVLADEIIAQLETGKKEDF